MTHFSQLMLSLAPNEGVNETVLPGLRFYKASETKSAMPFLYQKGIIVVGQGHKTIHIGDEQLQYNVDNYLVVTVPVPAECEAFGSAEEPFVCLIMDLDLGVLNGIINELGRCTPWQEPKSQRGIFAATVDPDFHDTATRLMQCLQSEPEARILGPGLMKELMYRILRGEQACPLHALASQNTNLSRVDRALQQIHSNYQFNFEVAELAEMVNMSPSAFHRTFKEVTSLSPIQYIKKVRLNQAHNLMLEEQVRVNEAARLVGYENVSHFSREFKKYFGIPPKAINPGN